MHLNRWYVLSMLMALLMVAASCQGGGSGRSARSVGGKKAPTTDGQADQGDTSPVDGDTEGDDKDDDDDSAYAVNDATYFQDVKAVLDKRCASCHATQAPILSTFMQHYLARDEVSASIRQDRMPPDSPLSAEEKELIVGWIKAGAPQGALLEFTNFGSDTMIAPHDTVEIDATINAPATATWSLYWSKDANDTTAGQVATDPQSIANKTASWAVTGLEAGDYYLYAKVRADERDFTFKAPQKVRLGEPSIRLASDWRKGRIGFINPAQLAYSVGNTEGAGVLAVRVEYKRGANTTVYTKLTDAADVSSYTLPVLPEGDDYYFRISLLADGQVIATSQTQDLVSFADQIYLIDNLEGNCMAFNCHPNHGRLDRNLHFLDRIKDASSPMPPNGVLPAGDQLKLRLWFWQNFPQ